MRKKLWLAIALVMILPGMLFMVSCAKNAVQSQPSQVSQTEPVNGDNQVPAQTEPGDQTTVVASQSSEFPGDNIQFEFDSAILSNQARQILSAKADYLSMHPEMMVTVEGHCDERGTDAYNIALGERRAKSAKDFLVNLGIGADRLQIVSYGEERPIDPGRDEAAWAKNRRDQFVVR